MPLTQSSLKSKLISELGSVLSIVDTAQLDKVCGAIAQAVVDEIKTNAVVTTTVTGTLPDGPESASGSGTVS